MNELEKYIKLREEDIELLFEKLNIFQKIQEKDYEKEGLKIPLKDFILLTKNLSLEKDYPEVDLEVVGFDRGDKEKFKELLTDCYMDQDDFLFYPFSINRMDYKIEKRSKSFMNESEEKITYLKHKAEIGLIKFYYKEYGEWFNQKLKEGWDRENR